MRGVRSETFYVGIDIKPDRRFRISAISGFSSKTVVKHLVAAFALYLLMWGQAALAATYNLTISGTYNGNIILNAGDPGAPSIVTAASGTFDGQVVTGVGSVGACYADNLINVGGTLGYVSNGGINIRYGTGTDYVNLYSSGLNGPIVRAAVNCGRSYTVTPSFSIISATPVPTLSNWAMFLSAGLLGLLALILLRRTRPSPA